MMTRAQAIQLHIARDIRAALDGSTPLTPGNLMSMALRLDEAIAAAVRP